LPRGLLGVLGLNAARGYVQLVVGKGVIPAEIEVGKGIEGLLWVGRVVQEVNGESLF
jgi:hypothetical protein